MADSSGRMMAALPAVYRAADESGQLRALLGAFEQVLLESPDPGAPAIAEQIDAIPWLFAPLGAQMPPGFPAAKEHAIARTPERFLAWLAQWVAFSPYRHFSAERLRKIVAGIVPLYGRRGTRQYLEKLLELCFDEISELSIDEEPLHGFMIGRARLGEDSVLAADEPFRFRVEVFVRDAPQGPHEPSQALEERLRAIVDFARPAHTEYELVLRRGTANAEETVAQ
jgi:phage tail-like protein